jgi:hypothetical protein
MKNVTITLDEKTAEWAKQAAAEQGKSLSRYVGELLRKTMPQALSYQRSMRAYLARGAYICSDPNTPYPKREELYDRGRLR